MSKVKNAWSGGQYADLSCGHKPQITRKQFQKLRPGNEVVCPTCADIAERVKAARREALEKAHWEITAKLSRESGETTECTDIFHSGLDAARKIIDKLLEDSP